jgi:hypothetical protein
MKFAIYPFLFAAVLVANISGAADPSALCSDPHVQVQRSEELQKLEAADQSERSWFLDLAKGIQPSQKTVEKMSENDLKRRKRVGEIFGEGCLKSAADYEAAYYIYQHGNTSDQFFQAFLWSKEARDLGAAGAKSEMATAVDRFLINIGHKQLFGTQTNQAPLGTCFCILPIENTFPESMREEYRGGKNKAVTGLPLLKKVNNPANNCPTAYCDTQLLPSPQGTVLGFW